MGQKKIDLEKVSQNVVIKINMPKVPEIIYANSAEEVVLIKAELKKKNEFLKQIGMKVGAPPIIIYPQPVEPDQLLKKK